MTGALRLRGPGVAWVPAVLRRRSTWRTVWRFGLVGPLVGALPWAWLVVSIPVAYVMGGPPALVAGLLFACWYHGHGRSPTWPWRAAVGLLAGLGATAATALVQMLMGAVSWFYVAVIAIHGVPAAIVVALLQKPAPPPRHMARSSTVTLRRHDARSDTAGSPSAQ